MAETTAFEKIKDKNFKILKQYVPVVARVHGEEHPEFHEVHKVFNVIVEKTEEAGKDLPELSGEFAKLREITGDYAVPRDTCESYEAVYKMLAELDGAYGRRGA